MTQSDEQKIERIVKQHISRGQAFPDAFVTPEARKQYIDCYNKQVDQADACLFTV